MKDEKKLAVEPVGIVVIVLMSLGVIAIVALIVKSVLKVRNLITGKDKKKRVSLEKEIVLEKVKEIKKGKDKSSISDQLKEEVGAPRKRILFDCEQILKGKGSVKSKAMIPAR